MSITAPSSIADRVDDRVLNVAGRSIHREHAYRVGLFNEAAKNYSSGGAMRLDPESRAWLETLRGDGARYDDAILRLHSLLLSEAQLSGSTSNSCPGASVR